MVRNDSQWLTLVDNRWWLLMVNKVDNVAIIANRRIWECIIKPRAREPHDQQDGQPPGGDELWCMAKLGLRRNLEVHHTLWQSQVCWQPMPSQLSKGHQGTDAVFVRRQCCFCARITYAYTYTPCKIHYITLHVHHCLSIRSRKQHEHLPACLYGAPLPKSLMVWLTNVVVWLSIWMLGLGWSHVVPWSRVLQHDDAKGFVSAGHNHCITRFEERLRPSLDKAQTGLVHQDGAVGWSLGEQ